MPDKLMRLRRSESVPEPPRPVMLAIAGDSAAGKTTLTRGIAAALGADRATALCVDDYHRYDRAERRDVPFTVLNPECNYMEVMEQHLQLLALGRPILKPVYDHSTGQLVRPVLVEPREFVIVEGLLPLHTKLSRACFDIAVYLDPPEEIRREWKLKRDCAERGYTPEQVLAELERREPESAAFIRPQRQWADISIRFAPAAGRDAPAGTPAVRGDPAPADHPAPGAGPRAHRRRPADRAPQADPGQRRPAGGRPARARVRAAGGQPDRARRRSGSSCRSTRRRHRADLPDKLGEYAPGKRSESLAIAQLLLLWHLLEART